MWSDNETTTDFLNYQVHCNLLEEYLSNPNLLPLTVGVFGDWGSGKSSVIRMLENKFSENPKILSIYFNSWLFENYEDAKISLLENIILELSKDASLGEKGKAKVLQLLSRVDYLKLASDGIKKYGKNIVDIIATGGVGTAIEAGFSMLREKTVEDLKEADISKLNEYIKSEQENQAKTTVKSFREDFSALLELTEYDSVVVFIDDLDRCLPERVVDTLEAIKLFISVEKMAFIIGADERIVRHAIASRYKLHEYQNNAAYLKDSEQIVTDYIEKLIQIPYRIPKLSPSEIESYTNLLFCQHHLDKEAFGAIVESFSTFRENDFYSAYSMGHIGSLIDISERVDLVRLLSISHPMSLMIANVLKGNPRQIKRFLNTFILRKKLANVARIVIDDFVLIKLMLLEYFDLKLFNKVREAQSEDGIAKELGLLENAYIDETPDAIAVIDKMVEWQSQNFKNWIKLDPRLGEEDLRNYFWLSRDKADSTLSDSHMVSPSVQIAYKGLMSEKKSEREVTARSIILETNELAALLGLLQRDILQNPGKTKYALESFHNIALQRNQREIYFNYIDAIESAPYALVKDIPAIVDRLLTIVEKEKSLAERVNNLIQSYAEQTGKLAISAKQSLKEQ
ncbi:P-loop NTPase fold protein [Sulfuricurvum sp.]|uniref:KAP family P-loop NTPase fold protein n=1 Tax=Sulfuricurvum sp. TaxID=2025608 RepID=UPI00262E77C9|nr:P-loop NTPase fold protein [Sulfuricurvum sp.]MDD3597065.1 P-loop NTPase fold protein [Sulfuricurvum sp.]